jgi:predicted DNA-binding antitoxin AbrB/MazE fold protein
MRVVKGIYDGGVVRLLEPIEAKEKTPVEVIFKEATEARDDSISPLKGVPGKQLLRFAGVIPADDLQTMTQTIEAGCERIDQSEW